MYAFGWMECLVLFSIVLLVFGPRVLIRNAQRTFRSLGLGTRASRIE